MNATDAKKVVIVSTAGTAVVAAVGAMRSTGQVPARRLVIGAFVAGVGLATLAEFQPPIAAGIATLMLVTGLFVMSGDAMAAITEMTKVS